jgi:hypothetical protein
MSMHNAPGSVNTSTNTVPTLGHTQQSLHMQSTTPSVVNGKDGMSGWLYKWTNVISICRYSRHTIIFDKNLSSI